MSERRNLTPGDFVRMLEMRAAAMTESAEALSLKARAAQQLITDRSGTVEGVTTGWIDGISPLTEAVFGCVLPEDPIVELGRRAIFSPTVFEAVHGRLLVETVDEIMGPGFRLDLSAEPDAVPQGPDAWPVAQGIFFSMYMQPRLQG